MTLHQYTNAFNIDHSLEKAIFLQTHDYCRLGFDCEILLIVNCEFFHNLQSNESQEKEYAMNNSTSDDIPFVQMLNTCSHLISMVQSHSTVDH